MQACTAAVVEINSNRKNDKYRANIEFLSEKASDVFHVFENCHSFRNFPKSGLLLHLQKLVLSMSNLKKVANVMFIQAAFKKEHLHLEIFQKKTLGKRWNLVGAEIWEPRGKVEEIC